ncbi:MAG: hypothetical protein JXA09_13150, partial [Anaerolineae bacterium]|nr:hypothetical protein [Anaerolineae bacterium]
GTTDQPFLERTLHDLWSRIPPGSPNRQLPSPEVRLFRAGSGSGAEVRALLRLLFGMRPARAPLPRTG